MLDLIEKDRPYVSTPEASQRSGLSINYIATLLRRGTLEGFQLARERFVYADSLERYMAVSHKPGPRGPRKKVESESEAIINQGHGNE